MASRWLRRAVTGRTPATVRSAASRSGVRVSTTRPPTASSTSTATVPSGRGCPRAASRRRRRAIRRRPAARSVGRAERGAAAEHVGEPGDREDEQERPRPPRGHRWRGARRRWPWWCACPRRHRWPRRPALVAGPPGDQRDADGDQGGREDEAEPAERVRRQVGEPAADGPAALGVDAEARDDGHRQQHQAGDVVGVVAEHPGRRAEGPGRQRRRRLPAATSPCRASTSTSHRGADDRRAACRTRRASSEPTGALERSCAPRTGSGTSSGSPGACSQRRQSYQQPHAPQQQQTGRLDAVRRHRTHGPMMAAPATRTVDPARPSAHRGPAVVPWTAPAAVPSPPWPSASSPSSAWPTARRPPGGTPGWASR